MSFVPESMQAQAQVQVDGGLGSCRWARVDYQLEQTVELERNLRETPTDLRGVLAALGSRWLRGHPSHHSPVFNSIGAYI